MNFQNNAITILDIFAKNLQNSILHGLTVSGFLQKSMGLVTSYQSGLQTLSRHGIYCTLSLALRMKEKSVVFLDKQVWLKTNFQNNLNMDKISQL